jgi:hypothetical protein
VILRSITLFVRALSRAAGATPFTRSSSRRTARTALDAGDDLRGGVVGLGDLAHGTEPSLATHHAPTSVPSGPAAARGKAPQRPASR